MRSAVLWASLLLLAAIPAVAETASLELWVQSQLRLEQELFERSLSSYRAARQEQSRAEDRLRTLQDSLDQRLESPSPSISEIRRLEDATRQARALAAERSERASSLLDGILEHLARTEVLGELRDSMPVREDDPVSGRWRIRILPQGQLGVLNLDLDGTLVRGSYEIDGGFHGSLRGTYVRRQLRLERVDAEEGFDMIYEGVLDSSAQRIHGKWQATLLNRPGPSGGDWVATRAREDEADE